MDPKEGSDWQSAFALRGDCAAVNATSFCHGAAINSASFVDEAVDAADIAKASGKLIEQLADGLASSFCGRDFH